MKKVKQIVIISGKGGTGKTTVTASLAPLIPQKSLSIPMWTPPTSFCCSSPNAFKATISKGNPQPLSSPKYAPPAVYVATCAASMPSKKKGTVTASIISPVKAAAYVASLVPPRL